MPIAIAATYDAVLSRVRLAVSGLGAITRRNLARDPSATALTYWVGMGSASRTAATDATLAHEGSTSAKFTLTTTGSGGARVSVDPATDPIAAGETVRWSVWVYATRAVNWQPYWERTGTTYRGGAAGSSVAVPANTWTKITGSATFDATNATEVGATHGFGALASSGLLSGDIYWFDEALVEKGVAALGSWFSGATPDTAAIDYAWAGTTNASTSTQTTAAAATVTVDRSTDGIFWTTVRGASALIPSASAVAADDYEFPVGVLVTYRARGYTAGGALIGTATTTITPAPAGVWLKNATRPYLNRVVTVHQYSDVDRPARGGVLEVIGRRDPVAVTDVRGSRRFDLTLRADTTDEVEALELALSFGDPVYLQPPAGSPVPGPLHAFVGDVTTGKGGEHQLEMRFLTLPLTEVEAPDSSIVGASITWAGVTAAYASWSAVTAARATWLALMESVSTPADEVVG